MRIDSGARSPHASPTSAYADFRADLQKVGFETSASNDTDLHQLLSNGRLSFEDAVTLAQTNPGVLREWLDARNAFTKASKERRDVYGNQDATPNNRQQADEAMGQANRRSNAAQGALNAASPELQRLREESVAWSNMRRAQ